MILKQTHPYVFSVEGNGRGGGIGTLADELARDDDVNVYILRRFTNSKFDYIINFIYFSLLILTNRKKYPVNLFDPLSTIFLAPVCIFFRKRFQIFSHGSEIDYFIKRESQSWFRRSLSYLYKFILRKSILIIVPSEFQKSKFSEQLGVSEKIVVMPWGVYVPSKIRSRLDVRCHYAAILSRLEPGKNVVEFINQAINLKTPKNLKFLIAGSGSLTSEVRDLCQRSDNCIFIGRLTPFEVNSTLPLLSIVVAPSELKESYGLSLRDAILHNKTCFALEVGAHSEFNDFSSIKLSKNLSDLIERLNVEATDCSDQTNSLLLVQQRHNLIMTIKGE